MGGRSSRERGRRNGSIRRKNNRRSIESIRRKKRKNVRGCITKSQHFLLTTKQLMSLWNIAQNVSTVYCYQNLYLILLHGRCLHLEIVCVSIKMKLKKMV